MHICLEFYTVDAAGCLPFMMMMMILLLLLHWPWKVQMYRRDAALYFSRFGYVALFAMAECYSSALTTLLYQTSTHGRINKKKKNCSTQFSDDSNMLKLKSYPPEKICFSYRTAWKYIYIYVPEQPFSKFMF